MALAAISYPPQFAPANLRSAIQPRRSSARHPSPPTSSTVAADVVAGPRPRSNPHSARAADSPPTAVSSLGGFRTPAPGACGAVVMGPASENLHIHDRCNLSQFRSTSAMPRKRPTADLRPHVAKGRVEMWRGGCRLNIAVSASFVWRCLSGSAVAPFPHPAHRTGQADFPHPALGQDFTPLLSRATPSAVSEHSRS
jgi:hypothetical protein